MLDVGMADDLTARTSVTTKALMFLDYLSGRLHVTVVDSNIFRTEEFFELLIKEILASI